MDDVLTLIAPDGSAVSAAGLVDNLSDDHKLALYRDMVMVRRLDEQATALQRQGELGLWAPLLGQEAAQIGSGRALQGQDFAFSTYREHGVAWCRGVDPVHMLRFWRGTGHQAWDANAHGMYGYQVIIGAHALHAAGWAMGALHAGRVGTGEPGRDQAAVAYYGDGAMSQGDVNEAFVFAASYQAPVVFFCQNNQWAISEPLALQTRIPLVQRASGFGIPGIRVDGNDVVAVYAATRQALDRARAGQGPTLIEAVTYRMGAHTTSDDPTKYRDGAEVEHWRARDPLARMVEHLSARGVLTDEVAASIGAEATALADRMREGCKALPDPEPGSMFDDVLTELTDDLRAQRAELAAIMEG
ncbi:pyruvate dehydrogenase (acetyl-transferring) E1 component subunit alpha [Jatrophihabitans sp. YIM 134969]